jgi:hypothetical protein
VVLYWTSEHAASSSTMKRVKEPQKSWPDCLMLNSSCGVFLFSFFLSFLMTAAGWDGGIRGFGFDLGRGGGRAIVVSGGCSGMKADQLLMR